ncbi:zinc finger protein 276 isoform X3 [Saccopteryx bilineata]|uniref:zinc finger protein 276 isoform X3 n=1 Tax=Saccopteryx bilineata TaxID=59482 RepID=UPI00338E977B
MRRLPWWLRGWAGVRRGLAGTRARTAWTRREQAGLLPWDTAASVTGSSLRGVYAASLAGHLGRAQRDRPQGSVSSLGTSSTCSGWPFSRTQLCLSLSARTATPSSTSATASSSPSCRESTCPLRVPGSPAHRWVPSPQQRQRMEHVLAVWGCDQGHAYTMNADSSCGALLLDSALAVKWTWDKEMAPQLTQHRRSNPTGAAPPSSQGRVTTAWAETETLPDRDVAQPSSDDNPVGPGPSPVPQSSLPQSGAPGQLGEKQFPSSTSDDRVKDEFSDLSEGDFLSEDDSDKKQNAQSSDESFEPYPEKKISGKKNGSKEAKKPEEPKIRKKPGPKPGWKSKLRCEREELPPIYKCPYQGCTAVYRGADGMKKHIKEHHEEVRERPCPHPGCNKVFMIDRYLQRHVKLIHTEVRNYICDECGQTFKQRKHLLVHQMRHSGAKPLQCEVCGFQCRQRASLKYHMTKHKAETELDFACDQCGRRFEKAHNLNVHMSMVHPLTQTQDKTLPLEPPPRTTESQAVKPEPT